MCSEGEAYVAWIEIVVTAEGKVVDDKFRIDAISAEDVVAVELYVEFVIQEVLAHREVQTVYGTAYIDIAFMARYAQPVVDIYEPFVWQVKRELTLSETERDVLTLSVLT